MNDWREYPEYNEINNKIELCKKEQDQIGETIDRFILAERDTSGLEKRYDELCDEMHELIQRRHTIASKLFK